MTNFEIAVSDNVNYFFYKMHCNRFLLLALAIGLAFLAPYTEQINSVHAKDFESMIYAGIILSFVVYNSLSKRDICFSTKFAERRFGKEKADKLRFYDDHSLSAADVREILNN